MQLFFGLGLAACVHDQEMVQLGPSIAAVPDLIEFGALHAGSAGVRSFEIRNDGPVAVTLEGVTLSGEGFTLTEGPVRGELAPGERRKVSVVYTAGDAPVVGLAEVRATGAAAQRVSLVGDVALANLPATDTTTLTGSVVTVTPGETVEASLAFRVAGQVDLAFLLDTTQSMQTLVGAVAGELDAIAAALDGERLDIAYGLATFEDYATYPFGSPGNDLPFRLRARMDTDVTRVRAALAGTTIHQGQDAPESTMEALVQAFAGRGYDMDCDAAYDEVADVLPWAAAPSDAFGGGVGGTGDGLGRGGFGFREGALPVVLYATNYELRDADDERYETPGGCSDAGATDVVDAMTSIGGRVIGVAVNLADTHYAYGQMVDLAERTGSYADLDGNGAAEPAVTRWSGASDAFRTGVTDAVVELLDAMRWRTVSLTWDDPGGYVQGATPSRWSDVGSGDRLYTTITLGGVASGTAVPVRFRLVGDGEVVLADETVMVRAE
jgi:hypothetical protein